MALTSLTVLQANKQSDKKAFLRIVPEGEDPAVLPHEDAFRAVQLPKGLVVGPLLAISLGIVALVVVLSWDGISQSFGDDSLTVTQRVLPLLPVVLAVVVTALLTVLVLVRKPSDQASKKNFFEVYRTAGPSIQPVPARAVKVWTNVAEGSLLIYVVLLQLPGGQLLVRHTTGGAEPFEAPTQDATFYVWELPDGWKVVQVAKRTK